MSRILHAFRRTRRGVPVFSSLPVFALLVCLLVSLRAEGSGQVVQGRVLETASQRPVLLANIALLDSAYEVVDEILTDHEGAFRLRAPTPGDYFLLVDRIGYRPAVDGILELGPGGFIEVTFYVVPRPLELEGVTASVERQRASRYLDGQGFYDRRKMGFGYFIGPEELERRHPADPQDLLRRIPGIAVVDNGFAGQSVHCSRAASPNAGGGEPRVYVDGVRVVFPDLMVTPDRPDIDLESVVEMDDLVAVEVFTRASQVPLRFGGTNGSCIILLWTKGHGD